MHSLKLSATKMLVNIPIKEAHPNCKAQYQKFLICVEKSELNGKNKDAETVTVLSSLPIILILVSTSGVRAALSKKMPQEVRNLALMWRFTLVEVEDDILMFRYSFSHNPWRQELGHFFPSMRRGTAPFLQFRVFQELSVETTKYVNACCFQWGLTWKSKQWRGKAEKLTI